MRHNNAASACSAVLSHHAPVLPSPSSPMVPRVFLPTTLPPYPAPDLPIGGHREFCEESVKLAYGDNAALLREGRVAMVQALSGTGACRLFAEFQQRWMPGSRIYIPSPTW